MRQTIYRVRGVEGHQVLHPGTIKSATHHRIGHKRVISDTETVHAYGHEPEPRVRYVFDPTHEPEVIVDTPDGYIRRRIIEGSLEYIETLEAVNTPLGKGRREPELLRASLAADMARAKARAKAEAETKRQADAIATELAAIDAEFAKTTKAQAAK